jgi:hypothetical protein
MKITYELSQKDFLDAFATHRNSKPAARWLRIIFIVMAVICFIAVILSVLIGSAGDLQSVMPAIAAFAFWVVILWALPRWAARKQFSGQPGAQGPRTLTLDETGVHWQWDGGASYVEWRNYVRSVEGESMILLYTSPVAFNIVPKRALNADELSGVRDLVQRNIRARL